MPEDLKLCEECKSALNSEDYLGVSTIIGPSVLLRLNLDMEALIDVEQTAKKKKMKFIENLDQVTPVENLLDLDVKKLRKKQAEIVLTRYTMALLNLGIPMSLEDKDELPITDEELKIASNLLSNTKMISNKFSNVDSVDINILMGNLYYYLGTGEKYLAQSELVPYIGGKGHFLKLAEDHYERALKLDPQLVLGWKNKCTLFYKKDGVDRALQCYDHLLTNFKLGRDYSEVLFKKGCLLSKSGRSEDAIKCFDEILEKDPKHIKTWQKKAELLSNVRWGGAIQCYNKIIEFAPNHEEAWISMGNLYASYDKDNEALKCLEKVLAVNPKRSDAWYLQGKIMAKIGRWGAALQCLDKALEISPNDHEVLKTKGNLLVERGKRAEAIVCYDKATELKPNDPRLWRSKAMVLKSLKRFKEAAGAYEYLLELDEKDVNAWFELADCYQAAGELHKVISTYDKAIHHNPSNAEAFYNKGRSLENLRKYKEAFNCYERALQLNSNLKKALTAKNKIKKKFKG